MYLGEDKIEPVTVSMLLLQKRDKLKGLYRLQMTECRTWIKVDTILDQAFIQEFTQEGVN